jgi:Arc/MetJ family transcription regulator
MRTTMNLPDDLIASAVEYAGIKERSAVVRMALEEFVQRRAELRLKTLNGSMPGFGKVPVPRRRPPTFTNS